MTTLKLNVADSLNLILVFFSSSLKHDFCLMYPSPLGNTVAFTALICLHPRSLRACADPRRTPARHGESPFVLAPDVYIDIHISRGCQLEQSRLTAAAVVGPFEFRASFRSRLWIELESNRGFEVLLRNAFHQT